MFEIQSSPLTGALAEIWPDKVIREMPYRELRRAMETAPDDWRAEAIAAACIGVPLDELLDLPGRYAGAIAGLLASVTRMHGLNDATVLEEEKPAVNGADVQQEASAPKH
jgi:hypothetical protein